jgi:hypothetical protein
MDTPSVAVNFGIQHDADTAYSDAILAKCPARLCFGNGIAVAPARSTMLHDIILAALIIVIAPLCAIAVLRCIAKTKRQRRPVHNFRLN